MKCIDGRFNQRFFRVSGCNFMSAGAKCRSANFATCEKEALCTGTQAQCPASLPMKDGTQVNILLNNTLLYKGHAIRDARRTF